MTEDDNKYRLSFSVYLNKADGSSGHVSQSHSISVEVPNFEKLAELMKRFDTFANECRQFLSV